KRGGSALILVVVVTVLLAVVGVMFLMVSRASEMETGAVVQSKDLDSAVDTVVARINEVLVVDLFGNNSLIVDNDGGSDEPYDIADISDRWLASLEPTWFNDNGTPADPSDDNYVWPRITDLYGTGIPFAGIPLNFYDPQDDTDTTQWDGSILDLRVDVTNTLVKVIAPKDRTKVVFQSGTPDVADWDDPSLTYPYGARADADGDGVADSRWAQVPGLTTSRGEPVFAAVRIIDNCAMLNLNTAHCFYQDSYATGVSPFVTPWYATEPDLVTIPYHDNQSGSNSNFFDGGTGGDDWYNIMIARGMFDGALGLPFSPQNCQNVVMNIENPASDYQFFDISDELEIRNRYLVTSKVEARFEQDTVANFTLDSANGGGGPYAALEVPRDMTNDFGSWTRRIDSFNFDRWDKTGLVIDVTPDPYEYDRRHVCTFYSYDRMFRRGDYQLLPDIDAAAAVAGWTREQKELVERVFTPIGPVTTDIRVPVEVAPGVWTYYSSTETRKRILHLLFAFREYFYDQNGNDLPQAAKSAAQVVANMIDYSDDDAINPTSPDRQGPFYDVPYGQQANADCTFITEDIIQDMIEEVSGGLILADMVPFGLDPDPAIDIVFGYEKQPFISEVYAEREDPSGNLIGFAIELLNPYIEQIDLTRDDNSYSIIEDGWRIKVGENVINEVITDSVNKDIPGYSIFPAS
ncbi:MAG: hypothetical protein ACYSSK_11125, partial [Planctomycetota bacterium]